MSAAAVGVVEDEGKLPGKGATLHRRSVVPDGDPWATVAVLHGYGEHSGRHLHFMRWLAERGVACHTLDFRGQGLSSGRRGHVDQWEEYLDDLNVFLDQQPLRPSARTTPFFALGQSHGALVLTAAVIGEGTAFDGCIMTAPYLASRMHVPAVKELVARIGNRLFPSACVPSGLRTEWMSRDEAMLKDAAEDPLVAWVATPRWYMEKLRVQEEMLRSAPEFRLPLLMVMGDSDPISDPRAVHDFYERCGSEDKTFRLYPDFLHEPLREIGRERVFEHILQWIKARV